MHCATSRRTPVRSWRLWSIQGVEQEAWDLTEACEAPCRLFAGLKTIASWESSTDDFDQADTEDGMKDIDKTMKAGEAAIKDLIAMANRACTDVKKAAADCKKLREDQAKPSKRGAGGRRAGQQSTASATSSAAAAGSAVSARESPLLNHIGDATCSKDLIIR